MFALRIINEDGSEVNYDLGKSYVFTPISKVEERYAQSPEEFPYSEDVYAVVTGEDGPYPLTNGTKVYIVTDRGATYANLTNRVVLE